MTHWGFVFMAYGIVWCSIVIYTVLLKRRIQRASAGGPAAPGEAEMDSHEPA